MRPPGLSDMSARTCGECTVCCKLDPVRDLGKLPGVVCRHCDWNKGCRIYEQRPLSCRMYQCSWLANPQLWHESLRPDRCGFVMEFTEDGRVLALHCDPVLMRAQRRQHLLRNFVRWAQEWD
jgi:hypothetical protein